MVEGSLQIAELVAVVRAFEKFKDQPLNLVTDLAYIAGVVMRAEHAFLKEVSTPNLHKLLSKLIHLISHRKQPYHIVHVRSHTDLPGTVAEWNKTADTLAMAIGSANLPDTFAQVKLACSFYHQNVPAMVRMFKLSSGLQVLLVIVATYLNCQAYQILPVGSGINLWGLASCQL